MVSTRGGPSPTSTGPKAKRGSKRASNATATNDAPATDPSLDNETPSTETVENRARKKRKSQQQNAGEGVFPTAVIVNGEQGQSSKRRKKNNTTSAEEGNPEPPPLRYKAPTNASPGFNLDPALDVGGALGIQAPEDSDVNHAEESGQMIPTIGLQPASLHLQIPTLPILDNLATQILALISKSSYADMLAMASQPTTGSGPAYSALQALFNQTKAVYSTSKPFLSPQELGLGNDAHIETIRKSNLATFASQIFNPHNADLVFLHDSFLEAVVGERSVMSWIHAQLYLDLKTQAFIVTARNGDRDSHPKRDWLFPPDLSEELLKRLPGVKQLDPTEQIFVERAKSRGDELAEESGSVQGVLELSMRYPWFGYLQNVCNYVGAYYHGTLHLDESNIAPLDYNPGSGVGQPKWAALQSPPNTMMSPTNSGVAPHPTSTGTRDDAIGRAARTARFVGEANGDTAQSRTANHAPSQSQRQRPTPQKPTPGLPLQFHFEYSSPAPQMSATRNPSYDPNLFQNAAASNPWQPDLNQRSDFNPFHTAPNSIPYPTQSAPTHVLYERARVATSKSLQQSVRKNAGDGSNQRKPWTPEEEDALMAGLDRVKGPHWSQIHALFGPEGSTSNALKDRSQVQLKDKARNLKLFFLKSGIEVPYYLQFVTGELKTRAPSRTTKKNDKEKVAPEDEHAHAQGASSLAGSKVQDAGQEVSPDLQEASGDANEPTSDAFQLNMISDINIDPALGASPPMPHYGKAGDALHASTPYTVPTPNMIMQSLDKATESSDATPSKQLQQEQPRQRRRRK